MTPQCGVAICRLALRLPPDIPSVKTATTTNITTTSSYIYIFVYSIWLRLFSRLAYINFSLYVHMYSCIGYLIPYTAPKCCNCCCYCCRLNLNVFLRLRMLPPLLYLRHTLSLQVPDLTLVYIKIDIV